MKLKHYSLLAAVISIFSDHKTFGSEEMISETGKTCVLRTGVQTVESEVSSTPEKPLGVLAKLMTNVGATVNNRIAAAVKVYDHHGVAEDQKTEALGVFVELMTNGGATVNNRIAAAERLKNAAAAVLEEIEAASGMTGLGRAAASQVGDKSTPPTSHDKAPFKRSRRR